MRSRLRKSPIAFNRIVTLTDINDALYALVMQSLCYLSVNI